MSLLLDTSEFAVQGFKKQSPTEGGDLGQGQRRECMIRKRQAEIAQTHFSSEVIIVGSIGAMSRPAFWTSVMLSICLYVCITF